MVFKIFDWFEFVQLRRERVIIAMEKKLADMRDAHKKIHSLGAQVSDDAVIDAYSELAVQLLYHDAIYKNMWESIVE